VPGQDVSLGGISYRAFDVPTAKHDRFGTGTDEGRVVGYRLTDDATGAAAVYLPGVQELTPAVLDQLDGCDCLLIDGTCWHDDELIRLGLAGKTAHDMGHLALGGPGGSLEQLSRLPIQRRIYIHINNTNPILLEDSAERRMVEDSGMEVAGDGLEVEVPAR
ncbi:MAG: MBL fold metallo-hydrolase, partial [Pseudonocardia sp.]|nr:MBL fold metallo-hydrolase [Pseudonocardia sp.]